MANNYEHGRSNHEADGGAFSGSGYKGQPPVRDVVTTANDGTPEKGVLPTAFITKKGQHKTTRSGNVGGTREVDKGTHVGNVVRGVMRRWRGEPAADSPNTTDSVPKASTEPAQQASPTDARQFSGVSGIKEIFFSPEVKKSLDAIVVDEDSFDDTQVQVAEALQRTRELEAQGKDVDCLAFVVMATGGYADPVPQGNYGPNDLKRQMAISYIEHIDQPELAEALPSGQPLIVGNKTEDGGLDMKHYLVKLPSGDPDTEPVFVSKLGEWKVVATDLRSIVDFYEADHVGPIHGILYQSRDTGKTVFEHHATPKPSPFSKEQA